MILWPEEWQHGWLDPNNPDPNAAYSLQWSLLDWQEFRELHYLGIVPSPFGCETRENTLGPCISYCPWGTSKHGEPRLHPSDE
jgi:hypothetical protein